MMVLKKYEIEAALYIEHQEISAGTLKEDNPLDLSESFSLLCESCRKGDLKLCQELITEGVNINARDRFDYTPLILASLCGHFEVVQLLLESGALCERDTFQGERCLYNALNDRIRNLLLSYDYSKSKHPLQPLAGHITSLLSIELPQTSDIILIARQKEFHLHKFILSARSPYFARRLAAAPDTTSWRVPASIPTRSLEIVISTLYFQEVYTDFGNSTDFDAVLVGVEKLGKQLEIGNLLDTLLEADRRKARQRRTDEVERGRDQMQSWFQNHILSNQMEVPVEKVDDLKWDRQNTIFADVLLCADSTETGDPPEIQNLDKFKHDADQPPRFGNSLPIGPLSRPSRSPSRTRMQSHRKAVVIPAHRAMLLRGDYFNNMFSSPFAEAQIKPHLPVLHVECPPEVLRIILTYLYTERADFGLDLAIDVLIAADLLFIEKLKMRAAIIISTLGNGTSTIVDSSNSRGATDTGELIDVYDVIRVGWDTRVPRLEEFGARYIANRLERFIEEDEFRELVKESAARIKRREATDTVELIDDIRYYLSERFRLRFEDSGLEVMDEDNTAAQRVELQQNDIIDDQGTGLSVSLNSQVKDTTNTTSPSRLVASVLPSDFGGTIRTLDGEIAGDEFAKDAMDYQILLGKIDALLEGLSLDA